MPFSNKFELQVMQIPPLHTHTYIYVQQTHQTTKSQTAISFGLILNICQKFSPVFVTQALHLHSSTEVSLL